MQFETCELLICVVNLDSHDLLSFEIFLSGAYVILQSI